MTPLEPSLKSRVLHTLEKYPSKVLLRDDEVSWTGSDILAKMADLQKIIKQTTLEGARVGISFPNWAVQAFAILAVLSAGRIPVILSFSDLIIDCVSWLKNSKVSLLISASGLEAQLDKNVQYIILSRHAEISQKSLRFSKFNLADLAEPVTANTGIILYTSGSTGKPKGILVPESGILQTIDFLISYFGLNENTVSPIVLPICHSMAINTQFFPTFFVGGTSYFINSRLSMGRVYRTIMAEQSTFVSLIGEVLRTCWEEKNRRKLGPADHVQHVQLAGGMISEKAIIMAKELFPHATIHKGYGLTEAIRVTMINHFEKNFETAAVGQPLPFVKVEIRNTEGLVEKSNILGQIFVKGPNVLLGISGQSQSIVENDGFIATGDIGYWNEDHQVCISGRQDSLYKINGHRVSGHEIERIALDNSDLVKNAKCTLVDDVRHEGKKLILLLEVQQGSQEKFFDQHLKELQQKMWEQFKSLSYFPKEVVVLKKFPRTSNSKIDFKKLSDFYVEFQKTNSVKKSKSNLHFYHIPHEEFERISG